MVDLWRAWIEEKAAAPLAHLDRQHPRPGRLRPHVARHHRRPRHGRRAWRRPRPVGPERRAGARAGRRPARGNARRRGAGKPAVVHGGDAGRRRRDRSSRNGRPADGCRRQPRRSGGRGSSRTARSPGARSFPSRRSTNEDFYKVFTNQFDEEISAEDLCDAEELTRLRNYLDKQLSNLQGVVARLANRLQRRLMAQQNRSWDFDLEEGMLDAARLTRVVIDPMHPLSFKVEQDMRVPRHGGDAAARQFGLDARPPDHRRRDLRRYPGAHAGALRRQGRNPGLHHAGLEGRPVAREMARRRQARQSRPPQRSPPHHLQIGRHAVAPRPAQSRPDDARGAAQGEYRRRGADLGAQPPAGAPRAAPHPDGDFRWRAGRRFDAVGQFRQLSREASAPGDHRHREPLARRTDRHRHRPRRHALLQARRHHRRCRGTGRRHDREARRTVRRTRQGDARPARKPRARARSAPRREGL